MEGEDGSVAPLEGERELVFVGDVEAGDDYGFFETEEMCGWGWSGAGDPGSCLG